MVWRQSWVINADDHPPILCVKFGDDWPTTSVILGLEMGLGSLVYMSLYWTKLRNGLWCGGNRGLEMQMTIRQFFV